ncbi:hypothetical protein PJP10_32565, partial [Mycobacterium kansasii]
QLRMRCSSGADAAALSRGLTSASYCMGTPGGERPDPRRAVDHDSAKYQSWAVVPRGASLR